ncbi:hypothetical protein RchiOBHm_Chr2g0122371 [Rosa chinensis]|uniref:Uncharacterized protein n=1 Tax=Rosa chinensis TaxID=74649 RepID=A0A2P6RSR6_ROSCH|nr:hypothetical protein RchiOBHm_Chr2g0122371 [Rosa chinensis]
MSETVSCITKGREKQQKREIEEKRKTNRIEEKRTSRRQGLSENWICGFQ